MPVRTTITLDIKAPNTLPRTREWPPDRPSTQCRPRRVGGWGLPTSEPRPVCLITDGGFPATVFSLSRCGLWGGGDGFCLPATSFVTDLPRQATLCDPLSRQLALLTRAAGSRPLGFRPARAGTDRTTAQSCARPTNRYQETPFIVIRKHRSTSRRRRRHYCTISSRAALWGISRHADRLGTAGMGRNTCANQRPHLLLQSSAF